MESYHHCFTDIVNDLDRHHVIMPKIALNTKFLNSLGPDWEKYVTFVRQHKNLHDAKYGLLFDYLQPHEKDVIKDRGVRLMITPSPIAPSPTQNSLALVAQTQQMPTTNQGYVQQQQNFSHSQSSNSQVVPKQLNQNVQYTNTDNVYYTETDAFDSTTDDDCFIDLNNGIAFLARAFNRLTFNNRTRTSSNQRNQIVV